MSTGSAMSRAAELDDCVVSVASVRYHDGTAVVRVGLDQLAFDDKTYVDLSIADAGWLIHAIQAATSEVVVSQE